MNWKDYKPGMVEQGQWSLVWDGCREEPFFAECTTFEGEAIFRSMDGTVIAEECVTEVHKFEPPAGRFWSSNGRIE